MKKLTIKKFLTTTTLLNILGNINCKFSCAMNSINNIGTVLPFSLGETVEIDINILTARLRNLTQIANWYSNLHKNELENFYNLELEFAKIYCRELNDILDRTICYAFPNFKKEQLKVNVPKELIKMYEQLKLACSEISSCPVEDYEAWWGNGPYVGRRNISQEDLTKFIKVVYNICDKITDMYIKIINENFGPKGNNPLLKFVLKHNCHK